MKYRKLSECMTEDEVRNLMGILIPECTVKEIARLQESNCINITFEYEGKEEILIFYPDDIDNIPEGIPLHDESIYQVYMTANGYSRIWEREAEEDMETGIWMLRTRECMEDRRREQLESDSILQDLLAERERTSQELLESKESDEARQRLERHLQTEKQVQERTGHISYVRGIADALAILRVMERKADIAHVATSLEELTREYENIHGLLETFGDGACVQLGEYSVTKGIYALSDALEQKNTSLREICECLTGEDEEEI